MKLLIGFLLCIIVSYFIHGNFDIDSTCRIYTGFAIGTGISQLFKRKNKHE